MTKKLNVGVFNCQDCLYSRNSTIKIEVKEHVIIISTICLFKRPARDACLCMGELQAPPAPHFVFLITL